MYGNTHASQPQAVGFRQLLHVESAAVASLLNRPEKINRLTLKVKTDLT
jgi:hypothetical protein